VSWVDDVWGSAALSKNTLAEYERAKLAIQQYEARQVAEHAPLQTDLRNALEMLLGAIGPQSLTYGQLNLAILHAKAVLEAEHAPPLPDYYLVGELECHVCHAKFKNETVLNEHLYRRGHRLDAEEHAPQQQSARRILAAIMDSLIDQKAPASVSGYAIMDAILPFLPRDDGAPSREQPK
jgi:hypothetical protein